LGEDLEEALCDGLITARLGSAEAVCERALEQTEPEHGV
jgi:hypothetical protein